MPECSIVRRSWGELTTDELYAIVKLRTDIFLVEQHVDETELDNRDQEPTTEHYWIADDAGLASYLRVLVDPQPAHRDAQILPGRVVTRADRRGEGLSRALLHAVIDRHGSRAMMLHAQEYVVPLYASVGFESFGDPYLEAGIRHQSMYRAGTPTVLEGPTP